MLKKLRWKFILMATGVSLVVLICICISVLSITNIYIMQKADNLLNLLVEIEYELNEDYDPSQDVFSREVAFSTRFFVVYTDDEGEIIEADMQKINAVDQTQIEEYIEMIQIEESDGIIDDYRYLVMETEQGYTYVFLDIEEDMQVYDIFVFYTFVIAVLALIAIFLLSCLVSKRAVMPIIESVESQKRFITDASHELKTPLAIIKADAEIIEIDYGEGEWTQSIHEEIAKLDALIKELIELSRFEEDTTELVKVEFSLSEALDETTKSFLSSIQSKEIVLDIQISDNMSYVGNEESIRKLFAILMDNAIYYANDKSTISVRLDKNKKIFMIENECEELEVGTYNQWFERFYRQDASRNSTKKGFGIGLSIAKNICERHNAKISARSKNGKTIVIKIDF